MPFSLPPAVRHALSGALMGTAEVIPGVSGGTMALIAGVYEALVSALSSLVSFGLAVVRGRFERAAVHAREVPWRLLGPLLLGMGAAIVLGAYIIPGLLAAYPAPMRGLFFGLVAASLFIPALRIRRLTGGRVALGAVCAAGAFLLTGLPVLEVGTPGLLRVFLSAAVAICAMILPGVSGAFLLEAMGVYEPTLAALKGMVAMNLTQVPYVLTFCAGAATGLGAFAKLLDWLLSHRHDATMAALVGLIAGALRALWPYGGAERTLRGPEAGEPVLAVIGLALVGFVLVGGLVWWERHAANAPSSVG